MADMYRSEDNLQKSVLFFTIWVPRDKLRSLDIEASTSAGWPITGSVVFRSSISLAYPDWPQILSSCLRLSNTWLIDTTAPGVGHYSDFKI